MRRYVNIVDVLGLQTENFFPSFFFMNININNKERGNFRIHKNHRVHADESPSLFSNVFVVARCCDMASCVRTKGVKSNKIKFLVPTFFKLHGSDIWQVPQFQQFLLVSSAGSVLLLCLVFLSSLVLHSLCVVGGAFVVFDSFSPYYLSLFLCSSHPHQQ